MAIKCVLSNHDVADLADGASINVLTDSGEEIVIDPDIHLDYDAIDRLKSGIPATAIIGMAEIDLEVDTI